MILNDNPNCHVSRILMNPRPILSDSSENDPSIFSKTSGKGKKQHSKIKLPTYSDKF
jgi:hypothetical protein